MRSELCQVSTWAALGFAWLFGGAEVLAGGVGLVPVEGDQVQGDPVPAFAVWGGEALPGAQVGSALAELEAAWSARASLDPEAAAVRVSRLVASLRPTLDQGQGDVLQMALFLQGVLAIDSAGGFEHLEGPVIVDGQPIPRAWADAVAVRPLAAPQGFVAEFSGSVYEQVRTGLLAQAGVTLDPRGPGDGEVRVDGVPVAEAVVLLPGLHTVSWHPVGGAPRALLVRSGGETRAGEVQAEVLRGWLQDLAWVAAGEGGLDAELRAELRGVLGAPAVQVVSGEHRVTVRLVEPPEQPEDRLRVGVGIGAWAFAGGYETLADPCGASRWRDAGTKLLAPVSVEAEIDVRGWTVSGGLGLLQAATPGSAFASAGTGTCADGVPATAVMLPRLPVSWTAVGRPLERGRTWTLEPRVRVGATGAYGLLQAGLVARRPLRPAFGLQAGLHLGVAANVWSGSASRAALLAGFDLSLSKGVGR